MAVDAVAQREARDAQQLGRLGLVAVGARERLLDEAALDGGEVDAFGGSS